MGAKKPRIGDFIPNREMSMKIQIEINQSVAVRARTKARKMKISWSELVEGLLKYWLKKEEDGIEKIDEGSEEEEPRQTKSL